MCWRWGSGSPGAMVEKRSELGMLRVKSRPAAGLEIESPAKSFSLSETMVQSLASGDAVQRRAQPGSMPVLRMMGAASGAVRYFSSARAASVGPAALCTAAENTVTS